MSVTDTVKKTMQLEYTQTRAVIRQHRVIYISYYPVIGGIINNIRKI